MILAARNFILAKRHVGIVIDLSTGSEYALHWALANLARDGDMVFLIYVNNDIEYGEAQIWMEGGAPLVHLEDIRSSAILTKYGISLIAEIVE